MRNIRYLSAQPASNYFAWQVEVMLNSFLRNNVQPNSIDIICAIKNNIVPENWKKLSDTYSSVRFFFYNDNRNDNTYVSSVRPYILRKHFENHSYLKDDAIFYHDSDIIFNKPPTWNHLKDDDTWYLSDCTHYIGVEYIKEKKFGVYERMCEIVGIDEDIPSSNQLNSGGGAQYLMKNIDAYFWEKVEKDSNNLYKFFLDHLKAFPEGCLNGYHPIQKWCADMWAVLWNGWYFKHDLKISPEMNFAWPIHNLDSWNNNVILHNAGVTPKLKEDEKMFMKSEYKHKFPFDIKLEDYNNKLCTYKYVEEIIRTAKITCLR